MPPPAEILTSMRRSKITMEAESHSVNISEEFLSALVFLEELALKRCQGQKSQQGYDVLAVETSFMVAHSSSLDSSPLKLNKVRVSPSVIHGSGVFAKQKITKGELITLYPPHYIEYCPEGNGLHRTNVKKFIIPCDMNKDQPANYKTTNYSLSTNPYYAFYGDPRLVNDMSSVGHMINDGAKGHSTRDNYIPKDADLYNKISKQVCNAGIINVIKQGWCFIVFATKDIDANE